MEKFNTISLIRDLCKEKKIPISTLEKECGFSNGYIRGLRENSMPADRLYIVSNFLGVSVNYLITGEKEEIPEVFKPEYQDLIDLYSKLTKEQQISVLNMLITFAPKN